MHRAAGGAASYLNIAAIIAAAQQLGADAVHPGYGFLSENAEFARACADAGLVFIGPSPAAIAAMGNKAAAKRRMLEAGVPCVPGYQGADQSDATLTREAERIGFPVMVKAAAGGGGRGMRLVADKKDLAAALAGARAEAENAFGSGELILEKAVVDGRHVEIQVLADTHGNVIHLGERDCSVQRRHQKVLEEAPSPAVDAELRARMGAAAVAAAKAIGYSNAGTVEFLLGGGRRLLLPGDEYAAAGGASGHGDGDRPRSRASCRSASPPASACRSARTTCAIFGHAIEARLYAEAPHKGFLPQPGQLVALAPALRARRARRSRPRTASQAITPLLRPDAGQDHRAAAPRARRRGGGWCRRWRTPIALGMATNRAFLIDALSHPEFVAGKATTQFIPEAFRQDCRACGRCRRCLALAAVLWFEASAQRHGHDPARAWSSSGAISWPLKLETGGKAIACAVTVRWPAALSCRDRRQRNRDRRRPTAGDGAVRFSGRRAGAQRCLRVCRRHGCISNAARSTWWCARRCTSRAPAPGLRAAPTPSCARR